MNFYHCNECGQVIVKYVDKNNKLICCKKELNLLIPNQIEANDEMHQIKVRHVGNFLNVAILNHPMKHIHQITFIALKTNLNYQFKPLTLDMKPEALFVIDIKEIVESVYAYCNLHGLLQYNYESR